MGRTYEERAVIVQEVRTACREKNLEKELATAVLFQMLNNYLTHGTTYIAKDIRIIGNSTPELRGSAPAKYVVNLYNDSEKRDTVVIRSI